MNSCNSVVCSLLTVNCKIKNKIQKMAKNISQVNESRDLTSIFTTDLAYIESMH